VEQIIKTKNIGGFVMRNLVYLGLLSLAVVFVLAAFPKFASADPCDDPVDIVCVDDVTSEFACIGSGDTSDDGSCVTVEYDLASSTPDDFKPGSCDANMVGIGVKATDDGTGNPCAEASQDLVPAGSNCAVVDIGGGDWRLFCDAFFVGFDVPTDFSCGATNAVIASSKLKVIPAGGTGKDNGVKKGKGGGHDLDSSLCAP